MSRNGEANRWWEGYLVRYLMPSFAGMVIVLWLASVAGSEFKELLLIPESPKDISAPSLLLLLIYGNLFCYVASYPILCFHATRVMDFKKTLAWPSSWIFDGHLVTVYVLLIAFLIAKFTDNKIQYFSAFGMSLLFSAFQIGRFIYLFLKKIEAKGIKGAVSPLFAYAYSISRRRGLISEQTTTTTSRNQQGEPTPTIVDEDSEDPSETEKVKNFEWRRELVDTYRHLREHGNTSFIFVLEIILASLCYSVLRSSTLGPVGMISQIGTLFCIWTIPSMLAHLLGQYLERRFSRYDFRLK